MARLTTSELTARLEKLPGWAVEGLLTKTYTVRSFAHAVLFMAPSAS